MKVGEAPCGGDSGLKFKQLVGFMFSITTTNDWEEFSLSLCHKVIGHSFDDKILLPSALATSVYENIDNILSSDQIVMDHLNLLNIPSDFSPECMQQFFLEFMLNLGLQILKFVSKTFRDKHPSRRSGRVPAKIDDNDRQVIYYVAGSIMKGYLRMAFRFSKSATWAKVKAALSSKVLSDSAVDDQDALWTKKLNRGGLVFITSECQKFMLALTKIVFSCEERNGSINYDRVIQEVSTSQAIILWDNMIFDSLPPTVSTNLMNDVISSFSRTCVRGFAKRRLNFLRQRPLINMPTRHRVARRKQK